MLVTLQMESLSKILKLDLIRSSDFISLFSKRLHR